MEKEIDSSKIIWIKELEVKHKIRSVLFDFDGTLSLIRQGWQEVMCSYFTEVLMQTPKAEDKGTISNVVRDFVHKLTGKQTIYQAIQLAEEVKIRGGTPEEPLKYKHEYLQRLWKKIKWRVDALDSGQIPPDTLLVPRSREFLEFLLNEGLKLYLASGTDEEYVLNEAQALGIDRYFAGIYGALDDYKKYSKEMVIKRILKENDISGEKLLGFGDGYVEIENVKAVGGIAIGVASNEDTRQGINEVKRKRLIESGADAIIADYTSFEELFIRIKG